MNISGAKKLSLVIASNIILIFILFFALEAFLRYIYTPSLVNLRLETNRKLRRNKNNDNNALKNNFDPIKLRFLPNTIRNIEHHEYSHKANIDQHGWRVPCYNFKKPASFIVIGDSFVFGTGLKDSETISCSLKKFNLNPYTIGAPGAGAINYYTVIKANKDLVYNLSNDEMPLLKSVVFMGNDFESFLSYKSPSKINIKPNNLDLPQTPSFLIIKYKLVRFLKLINTSIVYDNLLGLGESRLIAGIKIILMNTFLKDNKAYAQLYSGSTYYFNDSANNQGKLSSALKAYVQDLKLLGFSVGSFYLVPDPADIDFNRLARDASLRRIKPERFNLDYKYSTFLKACLNINLICYDLRSTLNKSDMFYTFDNHLNSKGSRLFHDFIRTNP